MIPIEEFVEYCRGKSICVVGHALNLAGQGHGSTIDAHDIVIRFSVGYPREELAEDRGMKVSVWSAADANVKGQRLHHSKHQPRDYALWPWHRMHGGAIPEIRDGLVWTGDDVVYELMARFPGETKPTQGAIVVYFIITRLPYGSLSIFGMDFFKTPDFYRPRAEIGSNGRFDPIPTHNGEIEEAVMMPIIRSARDTVFVE